MDYRSMQAALGWIVFIFLIFVPGSTLNSITSSRLSTATKSTVASTISTTRTTEISRTTTLTTAEGNLEESAYGIANEQITAYATTRVSRTPKDEKLLKSQLQTTTSVTDSKATKAPELQLKSATRPYTKAQPVTNSKRSLFTTSRKAEVDATALIFNTTTIEQNIATTTSIEQFNENKLNTLSDFSGSTTRTAPIENISKYADDLTRTTTTAKPTTANALKINVKGTQLQITTTMPISPPFKATTKKRSELPGHATEFINNQQNKRNHNSNTNATTTNNNNNKNNKSSNVTFYELESSETAQHNRLLLLQQRQQQIQKHWLELQQQQQRQQQINLMPHFAPQVQIHPNAIIASPLTATTKTSGATAATMSPTTAGDTKPTFIDNELWRPIILKSNVTDIFTTPPTTTTTTSTSTTTATTTATIRRTTRRRARVTTTPKPMPIIDDYATIVSQAGTHAYLPCNVKQLVKKPISWLRVRDGHILTVDQTTFIADQRFQSIYTPNPERWSLQIKYVQLKDAGTYECQVSTEPKASAIVTLRIVEPKTELIGEPTRHVKAGSQVKLRCIISQALEPPLFINWFHNQKQIYLHNRKGWRTEIERIDLPPDTPPPPTTVAATKATKPFPSPAATIATTISTDAATANGISTVMPSILSAAGAGGGAASASATVSSVAMPALILATSNASTMTSATAKATTTTAAAAARNDSVGVGVGVGADMAMSVNDSSNGTLSLLAALAAATSTLLPAFAAAYAGIKATTTSATATATTATTNIASTATISATIAESAYNTQSTADSATTTTTTTTSNMLLTTTPLVLSDVKQITTASLIISAVEKQDSGNYTCSPSNSAPRTVVLHVLNGEYSASAITSGVSGNILIGYRTGQFKWQQEQQHYSHRQNDGFLYFGMIWKNMPAILSLLWIIKFLLAYNFWHFNRERNKAHINNNKNNNNKDNNSRGISSTDNGNSINSSSDSDRSCCISSGNSTGNVADNRTQITKFVTNNNNNKNNNENYYAITDTNATTNNKNDSRFVSNNGVISNGDTNSNALDRDDDDASIRATEMWKPQNLRASATACHSFLPTLTHRRVRE